MPRKLGDVLDYFLPSGDETGAVPTAPGLRSFESPRLVPDRPAALPIVTLPIGDRDVVRAAFAWNLTVEVARTGACATLLAPADAEAAPLWPEPGPGPVGAELVLAGADGLAALNRAALDLAVARAPDSTDGGVVLVRVPPSWLRDEVLPSGARPAPGRALLRWVLLFASTDPRDLLETYRLAKWLLGASPNTRVGVTIHGARRIAEAERAFHRLAGVAGRHLGQTLVSYGLLVDDLHVYRAIVSRRPIGLEHPQSRAARALRDVARLLLDDARKDSLA